MKKILSVLMIVVIVLVNSIVPCMKIHAYESSKIDKIIKKAQMLSLGDDHSGAIAEDRSLYMWGNNSSGEIGDGTKGERYEPVKVLAEVNIVSLGSDHSGAITKDGSLYMWGYNFHGMLGTGDSTDKYRPVKVLENVVSVSLGRLHSGAVTKDGSLYMWGYNGSGQLGNGTTVDSSVPIKVMENVVSISLGDDHSGAITRDGSLYMWGNNWSGQLGNAVTQSSLTPIKVMDDVATISLGNSHSGAITKDGSLYMWGYNGNGQLGNGITEDSHIPIKVMDNVASMSLGEYHSGAITKNGSLYMWGNNWNGKLGNGTLNDNIFPLEIELFDIRFEGGTGLEDDPFLISTVEQLSGIRYNMTANYKLISDVDLNEVESWEKIGKKTDPFMGTLDGNNHSILNLKISAGGEYTGLFSFLDNATVKNISFLNVDIGLYSSFVGCIAGQADESLIENCDIQGKVAGWGDSGEIVGGVVASNSGTVRHITFNGTVDGLESAGIVSNNSGVIEYCSVLGNVGDVISTGWTGGGIVASNSYNGIVRYCHNENKIYSNNWSGPDTGGIAGHNYGIIEFCYNTGDIRAVSYYGYTAIGGICGDNDGIISDCYNMGEVSSDRSSVSGIVSSQSGYSGKSEGTVKRCYNVGELNGYTDYDEERKNELVATAYGIAENDSYVKLKVEDCYYLNNVKEIGFGKMVSDEAMRQIETFENFDFVNVWKFSGSYPYPQLIGNEITNNYRYIIGNLQKVNSTESAITIDGQTYDTAQDFPMATAANIIIDGKDTHVVATFSSGKIIKIQTVRDIVNLKVELTRVGGKITYQDGKYTDNVPQVVATVKAYVDSEYSSADFSKLDYNVICEELAVSVEGTNINFGEEGLFKKEKKEIKEKNIVLKIGQHKELDAYEIYPDKDYIPEEVTNLHTITAKVKGVNEDTAQCTLEVFNLDVQKQKTEEKKASRSYQTKVNEAKRELQNLYNGYNLVTSADLSYYLDKKQINALEAYLYTWIAEVNNANVITDDDKINKKIMEKLGLNPYTGFLWKTAKAVTKVKANTVYGMRTFEFTLDIGTLQSNGNGYGSFGDISYEVLEKKDIPGSIPTKGLLGMTTYVSMSKFIDCLKEVAEDAIKTAYKNSWGKHANEVAELVVDKVILDVINEQWGSFSNGVYTLITEPTKSYVKKMKVECPVDVYIYDMDDSLCGAIVDNEVDRNHADIAMYVEDDAKIIYLAGDDYKVKLVGNDSGSMRYSIEELGENMENLRTVQFENLELSDGKTYEGYVMEPLYIDNALYSLETEGDVIYSDTDTFGNISPERIFVENISVDSMNKSMYIGETIQLNVNITPANADNKKIIWESDNSNIAYVNENGLVTAKEKGMVDIKAIADDGGFESVCSVTVGEQESSGDGTGATKPPVISDKKPCNHQYIWIIDKAPTQNDVGSKHEECLLCGNKKASVTIPKISESNTTSNLGTIYLDAASKAIYKITKDEANNRTATYLKTKVTSGILKVPDTIKFNGKSYRVTAIQNNACANNGGITKVIIGANVKSIGSSSFAGCKKLKSVLMGKNITEIKDKAFYKCTALTKITIPSKVKKIGKQAFYGCKKLKSITIKTSKLTKKNVGNNAFKGIYKKSTIKVPKKKLNAYKKFLKSKGVPAKAKIE